MCQVAAYPKVCDDVSNPVGEFVTNPSGAADESSVVYGTQDGIMIQPVLQL